MKHVRTNNASQKKNSIITYIQRVFLLSAENEPFIPDATILLEEQKCDRYC